MQGKYKAYIWNLGEPVQQVIWSTVIPVEIKSGSNVTFSALRGISSFIESYQDRVKQAYVITDGRMPEKLTNKITAIQWRYL
jgi:hypothetical protein